MSLITARFSFWKSAFNSRRKSRCPCPGLILRWHPNDFRNPRTNKMCNSLSTDVWVLAASIPVLWIIVYVQVVGTLDPESEAHSVNGNTVWIPWIRSISLEGSEGFLAQGKSVYSGSLLPVPFNQTQMKTLQQTFVAWGTWHEPSVLSDRFILKAWGWAAGYKGGGACFQL